LLCWLLAQQLQAASKLPAGALLSQKPASTIYSCYFCTYVAGNAIACDAEARIHQPFAAAL
jgi:hypothetical protein